MDSHTHSLHMQHTYTQQYPFICLSHSLTHTHSLTHRPTLAKLYAECMNQPWPPLPSIPWGVEPKIVKLPISGRLVISTGRPGLFVWVANDPPEDGWTPFNLAAHHNAALNDSKWHFGSIVPPTSETTSYTGMVAVPGSDDVIVSYDRLANGWSPAPWPSEASGIFVVRVSFE